MEVKWNVKPFYAVFNLTVWSCRLCWSVRLSFVVSVDRQCICLFYSVVMYHLNSQPLTAIRAVPSVGLSLLLSSIRRSLGIRELLLEGCSHDDNSRGISRHRASLFFAHLTMQSLFSLPVCVIGLTRKGVFVLPQKVPVWTILLGMNSGFEKWKSIELKNKIQKGILMNRTV